MSLEPEHAQAISARSSADELLRLPSERPLSEIFADDSPSHREMDRLGRVTCGPQGWEVLLRSIRADPAPAEEKFPNLADQIWVINGAHIMRALTWVADGGDPSEVYTEVYANSNHKELPDVSD
jgi:hypothetical protein